MFMRSEKITPTKLSSGSPRLNTSTSYHGYEVTKEHIYDSEAEGHELLSYLFLSFSKLGRRRPRD